ncbi:MAG: hypothetical protein DI565_05445 [Ancylobacter novellus]|uniref:Uncharacterized protein n=1 Tax=Ancylobacter novellus TaxID=921 RepID=A0A2W5ME26_ANCNO|nr:MAG: hypothetical protein DI565_05445 [Ancylobacter novellus]
MNTFKTACAASALLLVSLAAAYASPAARTAVPSSEGRWEYDGKAPPSCNSRDVRVRHFEGDGHATGHEHLGHGHKWSKRNFKGYATKPPCYVRRVSDRSVRAVVSGEPS